MSHLEMIIVMAAITFATRISFLMRPVPSHRIKESAFLQVFPVVLFVVLAARGFVAPQGELEFSPSLAAALGGVAGAVLFKRSILGVVALGLVGYWIARLLS